MLICDSHDDANRDEEQSRYGEGEYQTIPWEMDRIVLCDEESNDEHGHEGQQIPDQGHIGIACHETIVHVGIGGSCRLRCCIRG